METIHKQLPGGARVTGYLHESDPAMAQEFCAARPVLVICPGGGYAFVSPREADPPALAFWNMGFQVFLLEYRVGAQAGAGQPLEDLARTVLLVRENSAAWHAHPQKVAVLGFSAGGHLAASLGAHWNDPALQEACGAQKAADLRPDAMVLCYPVITAGPFAHRQSIELVSAGCSEPPSYWSLETQVTEKTPPAFLWHTMEDASVPVENTLLMTSALRRAGVACECHLFQQGRHGLSVCTPEVGTDEPMARAWLPLCRAWLEARFGPLGAL